MSLGSSLTTLTNSSSKASFRSKEKPGGKPARLFLFCRLNKGMDTETTFKEWLEQQEFVEFVQHVFEGGIVSGQPGMGQSMNKPWSGKKDEVIQLWKKMMPNLPIVMEPMTKKPDGGTSSYGEDGVRVTGSWQFIAGVLSRLKEIIGYENPTTKLRLVFKGIDSNRNARPDRRSYVFYVNLQPRSKGTPGRKNEPKTPKLSTLGS